MGIWEKIIEFLVGAVGQSAVDVWRRNSNVEGDISILRSALLKAHLLIERSECWRLPQYKPIDELLPLLKDAVYEAEILVDELMYQGFKDEVEKSFSGTIFFRNWMRNFPVAVKDAFDRLDKISNEMKVTCDSRGIPENPNKFSETARPITTTSLDTTNSTQVYGRGKELNAVLRLIGILRSNEVNLSNLNHGKNNDRTNKKENVSVLSIVGMGGVGKTTFAQMVSNNKLVKSYFDLIIWVCVSDNCDSVRITREIIEGATKKGCNLNNLDKLQDILRETLNSKRFLLVLDDVWSKEWQRLLGPTKEAFEGSIVVVTTRSHKCVEIAGTGFDSSGVIELKGLEKDIYWEFFKSCAFGSVANSNNDPELEVIGKEICRRLKQSPLAARTIGGLLRTNMDARHWMKIKDSKIWELKQEEPDIVPVLQLSYQYLPSHLKRCFVYCALYPKNFKFTKWELTKLWIMHGLINLQPPLKVHYNEPLDSEGEGYFHDLIQRCLFQKAVGCQSDEYVIHDLMHDVCQSITKDECLCLDYEYLEKSIINCNYTRHLSVFHRWINLEEEIMLCKYENLLSVRMGPQASCNSIVIDSWFEKLTSIRSLSLSRCKIKNLPESIGNLKHLQYLDISFTSIEMLPESLCNLFSLLYLNMKCCSEIKSFPEGFNKLVNLRFLYWPAKKVILLGRIENLAKEIEVENMEFSVSSDVKIEHLKHINKVSGSLTINRLGNVPNKKAAKEAHLENKSLVRKLHLSWWEADYDHSLVDECHDEEVLQGLRPHPNLKVLKIEVYEGSILPNWFKNEFLPNLREIHIEVCNRLTKLDDCLDPNHFPMLKNVEIFSCKNLESLPVESFGGFKLLEELSILNCPRLRWPKTVVLPPCIKKLSLGSFGFSIPSCLLNLTSLESLQIEKCPDFVAISAEETSNLKSLKRLDVMNCAGLQSLRGLKFLTSLEELKVWCCPDFVSISAQEASYLKSLKKLWVNNCAELQSLGGLEFLASLEELNIWGCPKLAETGGRRVSQKLPSELLAELPSDSRSQGPETLEERSAKRARNESQLHHRF